MPPPSLPSFALVMWTYAESSAVRFFFRRRISMFTGQITRDARWGVNALWKKSTTKAENERICLFQSTPGTASLRSEGLTELLAFHFDPQVGIIALISG